MLVRWHGVDCQQLVSAVSIEFSTELVHMSLLFCQGTP